MYTSYPTNSAVGLTSLIPPAGGTSQIPATQQLNNATIMVASSTTGTCLGTGGYAGQQQQASISTATMAAGNVPMQPAGSPRHRQQPATGLVPNQQNASGGVGSVPHPFFAFGSQLNKQQRYYTPVAKPK